MSFYNESWDKPYLTPSIAKVLDDKSPLHAKAECPYFGEKARKQTAAMTEGDIVDRLVFGDAMPETLVVSPFDEFRTKEAKAWRDDMEAAGMTIIKEAAFNRCKEAADAVYAQAVSAHPSAAKALKEGKIKERVTWQDESGLWLSTEPDIYLPSERVVFDLKRTSIAANEANWRRHVSSMNLAIQVSATLEATGATNFGWLVIESAPPHCAVVHWASPELIDHGKRKWSRAKTIWAQCLEVDEWPGYQSGTIDPMPWDLPDSDGIIFDGDDK